LAIRIVLACCAGASARGAELGPKIPVIFDTDIDGDNDDVAAAAILHALADEGKVEILAMGVVSRHSYSPACLDAINTWYGRGEIPIGVYKGKALVERGSSYAKAVAERCSNDVGLSDKVLGVYRRVLAGQPDGAVTMIAVGQMNNLVDLLASPADANSDLPGRELVRRKVAVLFVMAPYFNERNEYQRAYNFTTSPKAAVNFVDNWPTKIKFGEGNLGHRHFIGSRLAQTPAGNPARVAFEAYSAAEKRNEGKSDGKRHCADPTTVLYAVCGSQYFGETGPGACDVREDGYTRWDAARDKQHFYNTQKLAVPELEAVMEQLLVKPPKHGKTARAARDYSTCKSWQEVVEGERLRYQPVIRVSEPGTKERPVYTGFWFFEGLQFDATGRYALAMKVSFQERDVTPADRGEIGYIDLADKNRWTRIGATAAWNWQQGCRLTWRGRSNEILWNDLADDGSHFVCRTYDFKTGARRTLPRPIYDVSRDGAIALTHDFQRMRHGKSTNYVGIPDRYEDQIAPAEIGIEKMDMNTGRVEFLISLKRMAEIAFPGGYKGKTNLYFFREGWNPSGSRFIAFLKNADQPTYTGGWSISADGKDVRFFYITPSHHAWIDDNTILEGRQFSIYKDDGSGKPHRVADVGSTDFDPTVLPGGQWFLLDTYPIKGYQHVVLFHRPSRLFVPLAKLKNTAQVDTDYRVDIHARTSRDGRTVCIDATHEGLGRQMYIIPITHILDHPPGVEGQEPERDN
jgi:hypothetical protein